MAGTSRIAQRITRVLDLPPDVVLDLPKITMIGNMELTVENHRGLIEYSPQRVRIRFTRGTLVICGSNLRIQFLYGEEVKVEGRFANIQFTG